MYINKKDLLNLKSLIENGTITEGKFSTNKEIVSALKLNGSVKSGKKTPKVRYIDLLNVENIFLFLQDNSCNITCVEDIDNYIADIYDKKSPRDIIQKHTSDTKAKDSKSLKGLYVSSLQTIEIKIDDEVVSIIPQNGMGHFLFHTQKIELYQDTIVVGVENYQVVWFAQKYTHLFEDKNVLFIVINPYMLEWIEEIENEYIHFGDYDFDGVNIYLNKVVPRLKRAKKYSIFIPNDIEEYIKNSKNFELYKKQKRFKEFETSDLKIHKLLKILDKYKRCFEQEGLANTNKI